MSIQRHRSLLIAGTVVLAGLAIILRPKSTAVDTAVVSRGPLEATIDADGMTRVRDRFDLTAPVSGLARMSLEIGDAVRAGDVLARIDPVPLDPRSLAHAQANLQAAIAAAAEPEARVVQTRASLTQAERTTGRLRVVATLGSMSTDELEHAELSVASLRRDHEAAVARAKAAQADIANARAALIGANDGRAGSTFVRAPASGRVLRGEQMDQRVVSPGTPLLTIGDAAALEVELDVLSAEAVRIRSGALVRLSDWGGADTITARVRLVEPQGFTKISALGIEEQRVHVIADIDSPPDALGSGYRVHGTIVVWSAPAVVRAPGSALFRRGSTWNVYVIDRGRARIREVRVGHTGPDYFEVSSGLAEGDRLILFPSDRIRPGQRVKAD